MLALVVTLDVFFLFLPAHLRKRILRRLISYTVSVLAFVLALRYGLLRLPELVLQAPAQGQAGTAVPTAPGDLQAFQPPRVAPWVTYFISLVLLWLILVGFYRLNRSWQRFRSRRVSALGAIANIARTSLAGLAAGRQWGDVVLET